METCFKAQNIGTLGATSGFPSLLRRPWSPHLVSSQPPPAWSLQGVSQWSYTALHPYKLALWLPCTQRRPKWCCETHRKLPTAPLSFDERDPWPFKGFGGESPRDAEALCSRPCFKHLELSLFLTVLKCFSGSDETETMQTLGWKGPRSSPHAYTLHRRARHNPTQCACISSLSLCHGLGVGGLPHPNWAMGAPPPTPGGVRSRESRDPTQAGSMGLPYFSASVVCGVFSEIEWFSFSNLCFPVS